jgi:uncharacterized membrane protein
MLYRKFHATVLNNFGFKNYIQQNTINAQQNSYQPAQQSNSQNNQPPLPPTNLMSQTHSILPRR